MLGIHQDMPFAEYLAIDAVNCSLLKKVAQSPAHARWSMENPMEPSPALVIGDAVHALVLEPHRFAEQYAEALDRPKRSKADKEAWEEWYAANPNVTPLKPDEYAQVFAMSNSVLEHETAAELLNGAGHNELTMVWEDEASGALCKGRADRVTTFEGGTAIVDLKTTVDASPEGFAKSVARFGYDMQAAWYTEGANAIEKADRRFLFICVEKTAPYGVTVQELDAQDVALGAKLNRILLRRWIECANEGVFTAYPRGVIRQRVPAWRRSEIDKLEE